MYFHQLNQQVIHITDFDDVLLFVLFFTETFILFLFENIAYFVDNFYFFLC